MAGGKKDLNETKELELDDYEIDLQEEGVDDESKNVDENISSFNITSYGADYTVDSIVKRMKSAAFYVPPFQRSFVWSQKQSSRFIESLLLGLPVPGIFLFKEPGTNRHLVIDGQQRLKTLQFFFDGNFGDKRFRLTNISARWIGKTFEDLEESARLKLEDAVIHATIFQQDEPKGDDQSIYYVFERINTGGIRLSSQEIRVCVSYGDFAQLLGQINDYPNWRDIYGTRSKRLKDQELILRFLAFYFQDIKYERPMNEFLNNFLTLHRKLDKRSGSEFQKVFCEAIDVCSKTLGKKAFRPERAINAAVFDSVLVGLARRLQKGPIQNLAEFTKQYNVLLAKKEYQESYLRSTADEERVSTRIKLATEAFEKLK